MNGTVSRTRDESKRNAFVGSAAPLLVPATEAARLLSVSRRTFDRAMPRLVARGLRVVRVRAAGKGRRPIPRYSRKSIEEMVDRAARRGVPLC